MAISPRNDVPQVVVLEGGPLDGKEHPADLDADALTVVMTDGHQHRYARTERVQLLPDGRTARVFEHRGRFYGPR